ncbi:MAG TPA: hypothetical protein VHG90_14395, partial [Acidimicrobiales bacterium]|nr:hypothetical protein [Acidimicrobiales bacterium]
MFALLGLLLGVAAGVVARARAPGLRRAPTDRELAALATASGALAAVAADAALTGWVVVDVVARAVLGVALVVLGAHTGLVPVLVTAASGGAVAIGSPWGAVGFGVAGLLAVATLTWRRAPLITAAAAGVLTQVALHLHRPRGAGATAMAAAVVLLPTVVTGVAALSGSRRRRLLRLVVTSAFLMAPFAALGLASALLARTSLEQGLAAMRGSLSAV